jgi:hypothetical protein
MFSMLMMCSFAAKRAVSNFVPTAFRITMISAMKARATYSLMVQMMAAVSRRTSDDFAGVSLGTSSSGLERKRWAAHIDTMHAEKGATWQSQSNLRS